LWQARPPDGRPPIEAVVFQARGFAAGAGTMIDEMMHRTGFVNVASRYGLQQWGYIALESLIADPPQLLLSGPVSEGALSWAERVGRAPGAQGRFVPHETCRVR
jgi:iron complex transport system substrate-binding protein